MVGLSALTAIWVVDTFDEYVRVIVVCARVTNARGLHPFANPVLLSPSQRRNDLHSIVGQMFRFGHGLEVEPSTNVQQ